MKAVFLSGKDKLLLVAVVVVVVVNVVDTYSIHIRKAVVTDELMVDTYMRSRITLYLSLQNISYSFINIPGAH